MHEARVEIASDTHDSLNALVAALGQLAKAQAMSNQVQMQFSQMVAELFKNIANTKRTVSKTKAIRDTKDRLIGAESTEEEE